MRIWVSAALLLLASLCSAQSAPGYPRLQAMPSPDGRWIAHDDKNGRLWLLEVATGKNELLDRRAAAGWEHELHGHLAWSPDGQALAVEETTDVAESFRHQIVLYRIADRRSPIAVATS